MPPTRRLLLYTKPPTPGRVKTRLIGHLSPEQAAALHQTFLDDVSERLLSAEAGGAFELWSAWALEAGDELPSGPGRAIRQEGAGLGERLFRGLSLAAAAEAGAEAVAALGSDHPTVRLETVREAFDRLAAGADAVLGPSRDGGYYLIALRPEAVRPELFEGVPWSTERVLAETLARAEPLGHRVELLDEGSDVDTPGDLRRLARELAADPATAARCPRTHALLAAWGYLARQSVGCGPAAPIRQRPPDQLTVRQGRTLRAAGGSSKAPGGEGASLAPRGTAGGSPWSGERERG